MEVKNVRRQLANIGEEHRKILRKISSEEGETRTGIEDVILLGEKLSKIQGICDNVLKRIKVIEKSCRASVMKNTSLEVFFGEKIEILMSDLHIKSFAEMARFIGCGTTSLYDWIRGKTVPSLDWLSKIMNISEEKGAPMVLEDDLVAILKAVVQQSGKEIGKKLVDLMIMEMPIDANDIPEALDCAFSTIRGWLSCTDAPRVNNVVAMIKLANGKGFHFSLEGQNLVLKKIEKNGEMH